MRILPVLSVLLAGLALPASAQAPAPPTTGERVLLVVAATAGGLAVAPVVGPFAPVGVAAATYGASAALGFDPRLRDVALVTVLSSLTGTGVALATYLVLPGSDDLSKAIAAGTVGVVVTGAFTGLGYARVLASDRAELAPAAFRAPTGEAGAGLTLRVGL